MYEIGDGDTAGVFVVGFRFGRGREYASELPVKTMLADLAERVNYLRRAIRAIHRLSTDYDSEQYLEEVRRELEKCFDAC